MKTLSFSILIILALYSFACTKSGRRGEGNSSELANSKRQKAPAEEFKRIKRELLRITTELEDDSQDGMTQAYVKELKELDLDVKYLKIELQGGIAERGLRLADSDDGKTSLLTILMVDDLASEIKKIRSHLSNAGQFQNIDQNIQPIAKLDLRQEYVGRYNIISTCSTIDSKIIEISLDEDDELNQRIKISNLFGSNLSGILSKDGVIFIEPNTAYIGGGITLKKGEISLKMDNIVSLTLIENGQEIPCRGSLKRIE